MANPSRRTSQPYEITEKAQGCFLIRFEAVLDAGTAALFLSDAYPNLKKRSPKSLSVDVSRLTYFDDYGAMVLKKLKSLLPDAGDFELVDPPPDVRRILTLVEFDRRPETKPPSGDSSRISSNVFINIGERTLSNIYNLKFAVEFVGAVFSALGHILFHPHRLRWADLLTNMEKTGVQALPIVGLISFLLGLVIGFMSSLQLQQFGANIYVASLVSIAMVSELGPIMTAIVVAGRSGSAFAAEIGTMKISEEIDALTTMGFDATRFLAVPRIIASLVVIPLLTIFADLFGILGGLVVGVFLLDLTTLAYVQQTVKTLTLFEFTWGLSKGVVFAGIIAWVGCLRGFQTRGGADAVGNAATSAVVTSIFFIILVDSIFAVVRSFWR